MTELPRITTERLVLRVPTPEDASAMAAFGLDNRRHFEPWDPVRADEHYTVESVRRELAAGIERVASGAGLPFAFFAKDEPHGRVLGQCRFSNIVRGAFQAAHLGYGLDYRDVGRGLMTEALSAAIDYCFDQLNLHRIMANYVPGNLRSANVLRRLGFVVEGYARDYLLIAGRWQDHVLTSLTNESWRSTRAGPMGPTDRRGHWHISRQRV